MRALEPVWACLLVYFWPEARAEIYTMTRRKLDRAATVYALSQDLPPVLTATSLVDVCLSKTQRKTPTEIHKRSNISVIKKFYIRKIKTCAQFFVEKLKAIITLFPKLDVRLPLLY